MAISSLFIYPNVVQSFPLLFTTHYVQLIMHDVLHNLIPYCKLFVLNAQMRLMQFLNLPLFG